MDNHYPKITQDGKDDDEEAGYIANMMNSAVAGFKYFDCQGIRRIKIKVRGYCKGNFQVKTSWDGEIWGTIPVVFTNIWKEYTADINIPDRKTALYFEFAGEGIASLHSFTLE